MSSSTSLLPKERKKDDHPIFLRVCHSPWTSIGQKALVGLRGLTAAYMLVSFIAIIDYELKHTNHGWLTIFQFSNIEYFMQVLYQGIAFIWTFMHLHYPHHGSQTPSASTRIQKFFSPPRQHATTKNRTWFSIFYTAANTFPHVSTFIHWAVLAPQNKTTIPLDKIFSTGDFTKFFIISKYGISSLVALIEVLFYSSIKRQEPTHAHVTGLAVLSWTYVAWTYVGKIVTDKYAYYFFDHEQVGWEKVIAAWVLFAAASEIFFGIVYGITGIREYLTKSEKKSAGYQQLPQ